MLDGKFSAILVRDILEMLDDKMIDLISFFEDFRKEIVIPVLNRAFLNPCYSSSHKWIRSNFYRRRLEGETLFGFIRILNKTLSSIVQFIDLNFNSINEAFRNFNNKFFIYSFFEVLNRFNDRINDFFSFCKYVTFLLKFRTNSFSYKNLVNCQKY
jgi:hypothetical protein